MEFNNGEKFSTLDRDNDRNLSINYKGYVLSFQENLWIGGKSVTMRSKIR